MDEFTDTEIADAKRYVERLATAREEWDDKVAIDTLGELADLDSEGISLHFLAAIDMARAIHMVHNAQRIEPLEWADLVQILDKG